MKFSKKNLISVLLLFLLTSFSYAQTLPTAKPEDVGMSSKHLSLLNVVIKQAIDRKEFPGAVILVARKGKIVLRNAFGDSQWIPEKTAFRHLKDIRCCFYYQTRGNSDFNHDVSGTRAN